MLIKLSIFVDAFKSYLYEILDFLKKSYGIIIVDDMGILNLFRELIYSF